MNDQTIKADAGKPQLHRVPTQIIRDIAEVREYGVAQYGDTDSWKRVEIVRYVDALYRHMLAFVEDPHSRDAESGIEHYKHLACNAAFICELMKDKKMAEQKPVKHGRWIPFHSQAAGDIQYCSGCGVGCPYQPNYCPNCGCKMDEGGKP